MIRYHAPWLALLTAAVLVVFGPVLLHPTSQLVGHAYGDLADHYWGTWWFGGELLAGRWPASTNLSHFPETLALWYVDPVGALAALPLRVFGQALAWNLLIIGQVLLAAGAGYVAGHALTGDRASALLAGVVAGVSPYALGLVHSGLSEYLFLAPVVLFVPAALRALGLDPRGRPPGRRPVASAAAWMAIAGTGTPYYALFAALFLLSCVPGAGWRQRLPLALRIGAFGALGSLPAAVLSLGSLGSGAAVSAANAPGWAGRLPATDVLTFFHPGAWYFPDTPAAGNPGVLHVNYLGWITLALVALGARGAFLRAGGIYFLFALGPRLALAKKVVLLAGASVLLPLGFLSFPGSPFGMIHQPYRMVALLLPWLAMGAAMGAQRLPARLRPALAALVLAETLLVSPAPWPLASRPLPSVEAYAGLDGPVLDWPPDASRLNRDYLLAATRHGQPVPYGVNVFLPESLRQDAAVDSLLRALNDLDGRARNRDVPFDGSVLQKPDGRVSKLAERGFAAIVVHKDSLDDREWARTHTVLSAHFGPPLREDADTAVWVPR